MQNVQPAICSSADRLYPKKNIESELKWQSFLDFVAHQNAVRQLSYLLIEVLRLFHTKVFVYK